MTASHHPTGWQGIEIAMRSTARTHVGLVRQINEDRVFDWSDGGVWAVIDGMGGHRGGDQAAQSVVDALRALVTTDTSRSPATLLGALDRANATIFARNMARGEQAGATVVALSFYGTAMHIAWAGDSRCYLMRDGAASLLTRDHSVVQELVEAGLLTPEAAAQHPQANVITRALGVEPVCEIQTRLVDLAAGDRFLLCSDGLSRSLLMPDLADIDIDIDIADLGDELLAKTLVRDGTDNISLVLVEHRPTA